MTRQFISRNEMLLTCAYFEGHGFEWIGHPERNYETVADVVNEWGDDEYVEFRRVDLETWTVEDITEDVAAEYLRQHPYQDPEEEHLLPIFVAGSDAWDGFCESWERPMSEMEVRRIFGTYQTSGGHVA